MVSYLFACFLIGVGVVWLFFTISAAGSGHPTIGDVFGVAIWGLMSIGLGVAVLKWG